MCAFLTLILIRSSNDYNSTIIYDVKKYNNDTKNFNKTVAVLLLQGLGGIRGYPGFPVCCIKN